MRNHSTLSGNDKNSKSDIASINLVLLIIIRFVLLIFCFIDLSIGVSGVFKSPTIIVLLLNSPFILVSICLTYGSAPMLAAYIFIIVISSSWIDHLILM